MSSTNISWAITAVLLLTMAATYLYEQPEEAASYALSPSDREAIGDLMAQQESSWNSGDLEAFMTPYLQSDSLLFVGKSGPTYGWATTLANYQRGYPTPEHMGKLHFDVLQLDPIGTQHAFMLGAWHLARLDSLGDLQGYFTLIWKRNEQSVEHPSAPTWHIIADHSS